MLTDEIVQLLGAAYRTLVRRSCCAFNKHPFGIGECLMIKGKD